MQLSQTLIENLVGQDYEFELFNSDGEKFSCYAHFFPSECEKELETTGNGQIRLASGEMIPIKQFRHGWVDFLLEGQGPGSTDYTVPIVFAYQNKFYLMIEDGANEGLVMFEYDSFDYTQMRSDLDQLFLGERDETTDW